MLIKVSTITRLKNQVEKINCAYIKYRKKIYTHTQKTVKFI